MWRKKAHSGAGNTGVKERSQEIWGGTESHICSHLVVAQGGIWQDEVESQPEDQLLWARNMRVWSVFDGSKEKHGLALSREGKPQINIQLTDESWRAQKGS